MVGGNESLAMYKGSLKFEQFFDENYLNLFQTKSYLKNELKES